MFWLYRLMIQLRHFFPTILGTVLRLNNEQVVEHMTKLAESTQQHSAMAGMVAQDMRALKGGIGREVRKELREAVGQINAASSGAAQDD